jgi:hypothetical protein
MHEARFGLRIGHRLRRASRTVEMEGLLVTVDIGGERESPIWSGQRPGGANDSQEPREIRIIGCLRRIL